MKKIIPIFFLLLSCSQSKTNNEEAKETDSIRPQSNSSVDRDVIELQNRRKEYEKIGYNYSRKISSTEKIVYNNKELTYVLDLQDSSNHIQGKVYVELVNDSSFKRLYILNDNDLRYFIGDNIFTNRKDTTEYGNSRNQSFQFSFRSKYSFTIFLGGSDPLTIHYYDKRKEFDYFRTP